MRWICGLIAATALATASAPARAQDLATFGDYPAGITTGSQYGFYPGGYRQTYSPYSTPSGYAMAPRVNYYSSGYYGGTPGTTVYGPGVDLSSPNAAAYGYSAPYYGGYRSVPSYGYRTYTTRPGLMGRGWMGRRGYR